MISLKESGAYALALVVLLLIAACIGGTSRHDASSEAKLKSIVERLEKGITDNVDDEDSIAQEFPDSGSQFLSIAKNTKSANVRRRCFTMIGALKYRDAVPFLVENLKSSDGKVRASAARSIADIAKYDMFSECIDAVFNARRPRFQVLPEHDSIFIPAKRAVLKAFEHEGDISVANQMMLVIETLKIREAIPLLKRSARESSKSWAIVIISSIGSREDVPFLMEFVEKEASADIIDIRPEQALEAVQALTGANFGDYPREGFGAGPYDENYKKAARWWAENKKLYTN